MSKSTKDSIVDSLFYSDGIVDSALDFEESMFPLKCTSCLNAIICSILPSTVSFSRIGIELDIKECPYYTKLKNE